MIVDDLKIIREGLTNLLKTFGTLNVIAEAENGAEALRMIEMSTPDIVLMDISMPIMDGKEATIRIKKAHPEIKILILSMHNEPYYAYELMKSGANGYLEKDSSRDALISAIETVNNGGVYLNERTLAALEITTDLKKPIGCRIGEQALNEDEKKLLKLICVGKTGKEISTFLEIPLSTFNHRKSVLKRKTKCKSDTDLVFYAFRHGIITYYDNI